ncbi:MAG: tetratricopeptide repeat protein [Candidatus Omnitrophica bacterium]|nr:tetratricopeptide repeat protein [Candidatus Omnitrophota bacterium]MDD5429258.1 tetratricopeptide repeat protein [Candidatus Omnitrophota bacterium]
MRKIISTIICLMLAFPVYGESISNVKKLLSGDGEVLFGDEPNSLMIIDYPENIQKVEEYLAMVDVSPQQVHIEARVVEVKLEGESSLGVNWTLFANKGGLKIGDFNMYSVAPTDGITEAIPYKSTYYPPNTTTASETPFTLTIANDNINVVMQALANQYDTDILSAPSITTVNNCEAEIRVIERYPWAEPEVSTTEGGTDVGWTVNFEDAGIILKVTPTISENGKISMDIQPEVSEKTSDYTLTVRTPGAEDIAYTIPIIETRQARTKVVVGNKQTLIIGGLIKNKAIEGETKIPLLGDIPYLGYLFKSKKTQYLKTELVIFVSPTVITSQEIDYVTSQDKRVTAEVSGKETDLKLKPLRDIPTAEQVEQEKKAEETKKEEAAQKELKQQTLSDKVNALYGEALYCYSGGDMETARRLFAEILALDPNHKEAREFLEFRIPAQMNAEKVQESETVKLIEKKEVRQLYDAALTLYQEKKYSEAYKKFQEVQALSSGYLGTAHYLKLIPQMIEREKQLAQSQEKAKLLRQDKAKEDAFRERLASVYKLAISLYREKNYPQALVKFQEVQSLEPDYLSTSHYLKIIPELIEKQKSASLAKQEKEQKQAFKERLASVYKLAISLYKEKNYPQALVKFQEVQSMKPGYLSTSHYLEVIPKIMEKQKEAYLNRQEKEQRQASREQLTSMYRLAISLYKEKNYPQALNKFQQIQGLRPGYLSTEKYISKISTIMKHSKEAAQERYQKERKKEIRKILDSYE